MWHPAASLARRVYVLNRQSTAASILNGKVRSVRYNSSYATIRLVGDGTVERVSTTFSPLSAPRLLSIGSSESSASSAPRYGALYVALVAAVAGATTILCSEDGELALFSGNANPQLAAEIAVLLGAPLGHITVGQFPDGEVNVQVHDNVRGKDVYIIQPTCSPVNENLMELLLMVSTMRRASADRITCVIPYYGYARQDRKMQARVPVSAADVARLLEVRLSGRSAMHRAV